MRCGAGNRPEACEDGMWVASMACGGVTPICSNGLCAGLRLTGGLVAVDPVPVGSTGAIRLVGQSFSMTRSCGLDQKTTACAIGGLDP
jgi:hypothetical protein